MQQTSETYREVVVDPANSWKELVLLLSAVVVIVVAALLRVFFLPGPEQNLSLQLYHRLDTTLTDIERPLYQALVSSQNEVVMLWQETQAWPTVDLLNNEDIPPFAADFMPANLKQYTWQRYDRGPWVDYLGVSASGETSLPSAVLRVINLHADFHPHPHPGKDYDPEQKAGVQIWMHPESGQRYPGMRLAERGWFWIVSPDDPILQVKNEK